MYLFLESKYIFNNAREIATAKFHVDTDKPIMDQRFWMNDADLAAAAALFGSNIFIFTVDKKWQCYSPETFNRGTMSASHFQPSLPTLLMDNTTKGAKHFSPVVNVRK